MKERLHDSQHLADSMVAAARLVDKSPAQGARRCRIIPGRSGGGAGRRPHDPKDRAGALMTGRRLDDVEMDALAGDALQRPILGTAAAIDDAQNAQFPIAIRASRSNGVGQVFEGRLSHELQSALPIRLAFRMMGMNARIDVASVSSYCRRLLRTALSVFSRGLVDILDRLQIRRTMTTACGTGRYDSWRRPRPYLHPTMQSRPRPRETKHH